MIDMDFLDTGADYEKLNEAIIIFLCPFAIFNGQRHIYTFENLCREDTDLPLCDGTKKIFLSSKGKLNDVTDKVASFLKFMEGLPTESDFVDELKDTIQRVRENEKERKSYMDYAMKLKEMKDEGIEETTMKHIHNMMKNLGYTAEKAMSLLEVPEADRAKYLALI